MVDEISWKKRLLMIFVGLGFATFLLWYINFYVFNSRAGQSVITTSWSPSTVTIDGAPASANLVMESPGGIGGFDIHFVTSGPVVVVKTEDPIALGATSAFTSVISDGNRSSYVLIPQASEVLPKSLTLPVSITCSQPGEGTITIDTNTSEGIATGTTKLTISNSVALHVICASGTGQAFDETLPTGYATYFDPVVVRAQVGEEFQYEYVVQSESTDSIVGYAAKLKYDPELVELVSIGDLARDTASGSAAPIDPTGTPVLRNGGATDTNVAGTAGDTTATSSTKTLPGVSAATGDAGVSELLKKSDPSTGTIELTFVIVQQDEQLPSKTSVPLKFKAKKNGVGTIAFTSFESKLKRDSTLTPVQKEGNYIIGDDTGTITPTASPSVTPPDSVTPTETSGTGNVILNLKARLQGIVATPAVRTVLPIRVGIGGGSLAEPIYTSAQFTVQNDLTWEGTARFDVPAGTGYILYLKGPNHLQKKLCDASPADPDEGSFYACDAGDITLQDGDNTFDFTGVRLLAGDNPDQDGVINAYDINVCRTSLGKSDADSQRLCDLNLDGEVNALDYSLVIANLSIKTDDPIL